jgi:hypothetical protein
MTMDTSGGGEEAAVVESRSIQLILLEKAAHRVDDEVKVDARQTFPMIACTLVTITAGQFSLKDDVPRPIRSITARVGWPEERHRRRPHGGGEV